MEIIVDETKTMTKTALNDWQVKQKIRGKRKFKHFFGIFVGITNTLLTNSVKCEQRWQSQIKIHDMSTLSCANGVINASLYNGYQY